MMVVNADRWKMREISHTFQQLDKLIMRPSAFIVGLTLLFPLGTVLSAQSITIGNDLYVGGDEAARTPRANRDLFSVGPDIALREAVDADAHVAGFSVLVSAATGGDLYAVGGSVRINAPVGDDLSTMGFSVSTGPDATIGGNARLTGGSVQIEGPVAGALAVTGGSIFLDAPVVGDAWITGRDVEFGPNAAVAGMLHVASPDEIRVPEKVAPPERVIFEQFDVDDMPMRSPAWAPDWTNGWMRDMGHGWSAPHPLYLLGGTIVTLAFLLAIGAAALALAPERTEALRHRISQHPWIALFAGIVGLSALVGLIPVSAIMVIGLPLVPFVILALILLWTLGYLMGVYAIAMALLSGAGRSNETPGMGKRLLALSLGLLIASLLNFVPFLGWMVNLVIGFLGVGAMVQAFIRWMPTNALRSEVG